MSLFLSSLSGRESISRTQITSNLDVIKLIEELNDLVVELKTEGGQHSKLSQVKGGEELLMRLDELQYEVECWSDKIINTIKNSQSVLYNLRRWELY